MKLLLACLLAFGGILDSSHIPTTLSYDEWEIIAPFILPDTHPAKFALDQIFSEERPLCNQDTLKKAGFKFITRHWSDTVVATHSKLDGYIIKMFTEDQTDVHETTRLLARIYGSQVAQDLVNKYGWNKRFKIPRKWLYLLPDNPSPDPNIPTKRMVLIAEDMGLLTKKENYKKWSQSLDKKLLEAVFQILKEGGFEDSCFAFNLPFARDGKIALIDNDKFNLHPIPFSKLLKYLHPKMQKHAEQLIIEAGPSAAY